jgi:hypothetical protein
MLSPLLIPAFHCVAIGFWWGDVQGFGNTLDVRAGPTR